MNNEFNFDKVNNFDKHISDSISGYHLLRDLISNLSTFFLKKGSRVIDLGCTSGKILERLSEISSDVDLIGFDICDTHFVESKNITLIKKDITSDTFEIQKNNLTLLVFTLQFIEYKEREILLKKVFESLEKGGALIVCEKEYQSDGVFQEIFNFSNYSYKQNNFSSDDILIKEKQLRISMNCLDSKSNVNLLKQSGFSKIETFFKSLLFKGYICLK